MRPIHLALLLTLAPLGGVVADPCGMVPPVLIDPANPALTRIDVQKTYVFFRNGIEDFVVRPAFEGRVHEFGMLIPCPSVPSVRKVPDDIFAHLEKAVDPPPVIIDLTPWDAVEKRSAPAARAEGGLEFEDTVRVIREEAIGMYQVAVLDAGSAKALERWMTENGYHYPTGMDRPANDYIAAGWCFVAVKTRVGNKGGVSPRPGMTDVDPELPPEAVFDGAVQAMGFRFKTDRLVVPMRLSAFNAGELQNKMWILAPEQLQVNELPVEMVKRHMPGDKLYANLTSPLPIKVYGTTLEALMEDETWRRRIVEMRDPKPHNGLARDLILDDLLAARNGTLVNEHEEVEKTLLEIGEQLGLRDPILDIYHQDALAEARNEHRKILWEDLRGMHLTIVEGLFLREVLAEKNLTFRQFGVEAPK